MNGGLIAYPGREGSKMRVTPVLVVLFAATPVLSAGHSDMIGQMKAIVENAADCPVQLASATVHDPERRSPWAVALTGPIKTNGQVSFQAHFQSRRSGVVAVEVEWTALNGMDEAIASRKIVYSFKHPVDAGHEKTDYLESDRLADDAAKYRAAITRVKFEDGSMWPAADQPDRPAAAH